ncbi:amino acid ABC transporter substrate-binding protein [Leptolyngbya sp. FACHB-321]|uniref:ABC transporter substrate-binding protein n=1 Tax=Leptolyngbya sp. FACHB-321 TaxID=2692807 RepID=UPI0016825BEA|nr:ABC transporter substrate-binding protein [Leptolyngbya sp. FACHB-321]MBD2034586.1 amino acid ABC transporter substrate-binding protein [Leptolyngbya sp. FACHB-321]
MSQKNEMPVLVLALLLTVGVLGAGFWWLMPKAGIKLGSQLTTQENTSVDDRISQGERSLVQAESKANNPVFVQAKQAGIQAMAAKQYGEATAQFQLALQSARNAPETAIYLNNAYIGTKRSHTIAVAVPIGSDPNGSLEILRGVAQAQLEFNTIRQAIPLKVVITNDDNNPNTAQQIANTLVEMPDVLGVIGHYASDVTLAAGNVYNAGGLVSISPISSTVKLSGFGKYIFRTVPSDYVAARALADYAIKRLQQKKAVVFFNSQSAYSQSLKAEFVTAIALSGGQVSAEFDLSAPNFSAAQAVNQALKQEAQLLMLAANTGTLDQALQVVQINQRRLSLVGGDDVYAPKTLEVGGTQAEGMVLAVPWHIDGNLKSAFPRQSRQLWGGDVNWRTATAYDATKALAVAIARNPTRSGVQQALTASDFAAAGASEPVRFLPSGDRSVGIQLVKVAPGKRFGSGIDFVPLAW